MYTNVTCCDQDVFTAQAARMLHKIDRAAVLAVDRSEVDVLTALRTVDHVFTDADGTILDQGMTALSDAYCQDIAKLSALGVRTTIITGKPLTEVIRLVSSLPSGLPVDIIFEKGAYYLERSSLGDAQKRYLLATPEIEAQVGEMKKRLEHERQSIENKYVDAKGRPLATIGWAGDGTHTSILSIDILVGTPPNGYLEIKADERARLKITDPVLIRQIVDDLQQFVARYQTGWQLVDLGNANIEIAPSLIEKDEAIMSRQDFMSAKGVLVLGDSNNDRKMFRMRRLDKVYAGLVLHTEKSTLLAEDVDLISFGIANAYPILSLLLAAHVDDAPTFA
jgi:HAD superfamily hydrolase (TIGR01484 family)